MTAPEALEYALDFLGKNQNLEVYGQPARCRGCGKAMAARTAWEHTPTCPHRAAVDVLVGVLKKMKEKG